MEIIANTPTPKLVLVIFQFQPLHGFKFKALGDYRHTGCAGSSWFTGL